MSTTKRKRGADAFAVRAQEVLAYAQQQAAGCRDWVQLHNAIFGLGGKATEEFPTESDSTRFAATTECKEIHALMEKLPYPPVAGVEELLAHAHGAISVRLPKSAHAALLVEAQAEGVSLNQLCVAKLMLQLKPLVSAAK
jgi:hypothetical protein